MTTSTTLAELDEQQRQLDIASLRRHTAYRRFNLDDHVAAFLRQPAPTICPHCSTPRMTAHHLRDAGNLGPAAAEMRGYCPVLATKRGGTE